MVTDRLNHKHKTGWPTVRKLYTIEQAAEVSEESIEQICYQIKTGKLKAYHLGDGRVRIDEADLTANMQPRELEW